MNDDTNTNRDLGEQGREDQGQGTMDKLKGKAQEGWGKLTNDQSDQLQGKMKQGKGDLEQGAGQAESDLNNALDN